MCEYFYISGHWTVTCVLQLSLASRDVRVRLISDSELSVGVNVSVNDFICVGPVVEWWHFQCVPSCPVL